MRPFISKIFKQSPFWVFTAILSIVVCLCEALRYNTTNYNTTRYKIRSVITKLKMTFAKIVKKIQQY